MGTFRVYGDSFSVDLGLDWQYINRLQKYLDLPQENLSIFGCANEWIVKNLLYDLIYDIIKPGDFILLVNTSETRNWLLKHLPDVSNFNGISDLHTALNSREIAAIKSYIIYLQNTDLNIQRHVANSALIKNLLTAAEDRGARTLTLPGFFNPLMSDESAQWLDNYIYKDPTTKGSLNDDVCFKEFDSINTSLMWYRAYDLPDIRANHMLKQNHDVLYNKIIDHLEHGTTIDLTQGFATEIITPKRQHQYWNYRGETVDLDYWSTNRKLGGDETAKVKRLLQRLEDLENSRDNLPFHRSPFH